MRIEETKKIRRTVGMTQEEFAKELGLSRMTIAFWEIGKYEPSPMAIKRLIEFCKEHKIRITR